MSDPLRLVVDRYRWQDTDLWRDVLECGHHLNEPSDVYGPQQQRRRRRCFKCAAGLPSDASQEG